MSTEQWALLLSSIALLVSIGIPLFHWRSNKKRTEATARTLLLQRILTAKSVTFVSMHELIWLLQKHGTQMEDKQRNNLENMVPRMRTHHDELEKLHEEWSDFDDGKGVKDIELELVDIDTACSDAEDTAKLIENGRRSYEDI